MEGKERNSILEPTGKEIFFGYRTLFVFFQIDEFTHILLKSNSNAFEIVSSQIFFTKE